MRQRTLKSQWLPAALLALGVVMTLGSMGDAALAMAVCTRETLLTRSEGDAVELFMASLAHTKPAQPQHVIPALHAEPQRAPRVLTAQITPFRPAIIAHELPHLLALPPPLS